MVFEMSNEYCWLYGIKQGAFSHVNGTALSKILYVEGDPYTQTVVQMALSARVQEIWSPCGG